MCLVLHKIFKSEAVKNSMDKNVNANKNFLKIGQNDFLAFFFLAKLKIGFIFMNDMILQEVLL